MSWIFCTKCFIRPAQDSGRKYFITNCCHILCNHCAKLGDSICRRCQVPCRMVLINNEMPEEVKDVFSDVSERATMLIKALEYQEWHRSRLIEHYRIVAQKYDAAKQYIKDIEVKFTNLQQKYEAAKLKIKEQGNNIQELHMKICFYKEKYGSSETPRNSQPLANLNFEAPRFPAKSPMPGSGKRRPTPIESLFTPSSMYRNTNHPPFTPDSSGSVQSSLMGSMSSYSGRNRTLPGYTPPSKTMELLTLLNKSRSQK